MLSTHYDSAAPTRAEVDALAGPVLLEFGTNWCGHCQAAQPVLASAWADGAVAALAAAAQPALRHIKVEDGPGRALGRSFRVKLWPTLVFLRDGHELARLVRPADPAALQSAFSLILNKP
jgi:thioredoxin 1